MIADAGPTPPAVLEEIVVTARRVEESLQRVPIAVTALAGEQLQRSVVTQLTQAQYLAPSLVIWPVLANNASATISLRGQVEPDLVPTYDQAVGVYLDGVYIARATGANLALVDLQRVEILRGPQGTLFGRNAIGGAINLVTNRPTDRMEGSFEVRLGNYSRGDLVGMLNAPLNANTALRIAAMHTEHDGYGRASRLHEDLNADDTNYLRMQLQHDFDSPWRTLVSVDLTCIHTSSQLVTLEAAYPPATDIPDASGHPEDDLNGYADPPLDDVQSNRAGRFVATVGGVAAEVTRQFTRAEFTSITAVRDLDLEATNTDLDGTPYDVAATRRRTQHEKEFSQELQWHGTTESSVFDWTAGLVYFVESAEIHGHSIDEVPLQTTEALLRGTARNDSWAAYGQTDLRVSPDVRLTAGLRYNVDGRELVSRNAAFDDGTLVCRLVPELLDHPGACRATLPRREYHYVPFSIGIDYSPEAARLYYAKVSRGQRAGGYNMRGGTPLDLLTFEPETVYSYEVGAKLDLFDGRLRADLALYHTRYESMQLGKFVTDPTYGTAAVKLNAGDARIDGGELEVTGLLGSVRLAGTLGISDGKYTRLDPDTAWVTLDTRLALPRTTYSVSADLPMHLHLGLLGLHADYAWRSDDADLSQRCDCYNAYGLLNAVVSLRLDAPRIEFSLWGRNLADRRYMAQWVDFGDLIDSVPGDPRTFGLSARFEFGAHRD